MKKKKKINVKFAGFCWKIIATTNTGGVKIIYNGPAVDDGKHWGAGKLYKTMEDYKKSKQKSKPPRILQFVLHL